MKTLNFAVLFVLLFVCNSYSQTPLEKLEKAYKDSSLAGLREFFDEWHSTTPADDTSWMNQDDTIKTVYELYNHLYNPEELKKIIREDGEDSLKYRGIKYAIIQHDLRYKVTSKSLMLDTFTFHTYYSGDLSFSQLIEEGRVYLRLFPTMSEINANTTEYKIFDFRPIVSLKSAKALYLTTQYKEVLLKFVGDKLSPYATLGVLSSPKAREESDKRKKFLENFVKINRTDWGTGWDFETYPDVNAIILDRSLNRAIVYERYQGEVYELLYGKENGEWKRIARLTVTM